MKLNTSPTRTRRCFLNIKSAMWVLPKCSNGTIFSALFALIEIDDSMTNQINYAPVQAADHFNCISSNGSYIGVLLELGAQYPFDSRVLHQGTSIHRDLSYIAVWSAEKKCNQFGFRDIEGKIASFIQTVMLAFDGKKDQLPISGRPDF